MSSSLQWGNNDEVHNRIDHSLSFSEKNRKNYRIVIIIAITKVCSYKYQLFPECIKALRSSNLNVVPIYLRSGG